MLKVGGAEILNDGCESRGSPEAAAHQTDRGTARKGEDAEGQAGTNSEDGPNVPSPAFGEDEHEYTSHNRDVANTTTVQ